MTEAELQALEMNATQLQAILYQGDPFKPVKVDLVTIGATMERLHRAAVEIRRLQEENALLRRSLEMACKP